MDYGGGVQASQDDIGHDNDDDGADYNDDGGDDDCNNGYDDDKSNYYNDCSTHHSCGSAKMITLVNPVDGSVGISGSSGGEYTSVGDAQLESKGMSLFSIIAVD